MKKLLTALFLSFLAFGPAMADDTKTDGEEMTTEEGTTTEEGAEEGAEEGHDHGHAH